MATSKKLIKKSVRKRAAGKKKSPLLSTLSSLKYLFIWIVMAMLVFISILFVYDRFSAKNAQETPKVAQEQQVPKTTTPKTEKKKPSASVDKPKPETEKPVSKQSASLSLPKDAEIPRMLKQQEEQVIRYTGHTVSYNVNYKVSNWVAWELTANEAISTENGRSNKFVPDPTLKGQTALNEDYSRTGYDKGHLLPAGDVKWSSKAMRESFYYSNICPQVPGLNRGLWKDLEEQCRLWAKEFGTLLIVAGPVIEDDLKRLGTHRVAIPRRFYKVIATISNQKYQGIAFIMDNKDYGSTSLQEMAIPIDSVEKVTGIDFFSVLPDQPENEMEASVGRSCWSF